jgi:hypothetical protein
LEVEGKLCWIQYKFLSFVVNFNILNQMWTLRKEDENGRGGVSAGYGGLGKEVA